MLNSNFIYIALALGVVGYGGYIVDTLRGVTKPNRISWLIWGLSAIITYLSQLKLGGGIQSLYTLMQVILPLSIFFASFVNKKAYWKITARDLFCGLISVVALLFLVYPHTGIVALVLGITCDFFASIPTLVKCYTDPETESWKTYALAIVSSLVVVLTIHHLVFVDYSFALYVCLINIVFTTLILYPRSTLSSSKLSH